MTAKKIDVNPDLAFLDITPDLTADAQRRLNASLADIANLPLPDLRIQAQAGDFISRILGTSDPAAIGQFVGANGLTSSTIIAGKSYVLPSGTLSGDALNRASALGQSALNTDNVRLQARTDAVDAQAASAGAAWGQAGYRTVGAIADALIDGTSMAAQVKPILGGERLRTATMGAIAPRRITAISHCTRSVAMA